MIFLKAFLQNIFFLSDFYSLESFLVRIFSTMLRKLNGSKEALSKDNKSMNAFKKNGFRYVVLRNRIFYPFMKFLIYLTELRLWYIQFYQQILWNLFKRRYNFSLCKTESVNFPILIFARTFSFVLGFFCPVYLLSWRVSKKFHRIRTTRNSFALKAAV